MQCIHSENFRPGKQNSEQKQLRQGKVNEQRVITTIKDCNEMYLTVAKQQMTATKCT